MDRLKRSLNQFRGRSLVQDQSGSALTIIFMAIGLLAALTFAFVESGQQSTVTQNVFKLSEELNSQARVIQSAVQECILEYPGGGDPMNNPNQPFPLDPSDVNNPNGAAGNDNVENLQCPGAPTARANLFTGTGARFLPPPPSGFNAWTFTNDTDGVRFQIIAPVVDVTVTNVMTQLDNKFSSCEADVNYAGCGAGCFTIWIKRNVAC